MHLDTHSLTQLLSDEIFPHLHGLHGVISEVMYHLLLVLGVRVPKPSNVDHTAVVEGNKDGEEPSGGKHMLLE